MSQIYELIDRLIEREGGYVDHSADRGGPTKYGITIKTLSAYRGHECEANDVQDLGIEEARSIYERNYWSAPGFDDLSISGVAKEMLFDAGVHSGPSRAVKFLQGAIGVNADGSIGPVTRSAAMLMTPVKLAANIMAERNTYLGRIITSDPSQAVFDHGWEKRISELIRMIPYAADEVDGNV